MSPPMTPEIAEKLNSERNQDKWEWRKLTTQFHLHPIGLTALSPNKYDTSETQAKVMANLHFIANAPAVYDAYIEMAKVQKELVVDLEAMRLELQIKRVMLAQTVLESGLDKTVPLRQLAEEVQKDFLCSELRAEEALKKAGAL